MKTLLLVFWLADLAVRANLLEATLATLDGFTQAVSRPIPGHAPERRHQYWASAGMVRAALSLALAGPVGPQKDVWSWLYLDDRKVRLVDVAFRRRFGAPLVKSRQGGFTAYDGAGLQAAFRAVYLPPSPRTRELYEPFRGFVAGAAQATACVLSHRAQMERMARQYRASGAFDASAFDCVDPFDAVTVGVILRRHLDGTLPVLLESLRTVLCDYDPETFAELDAQLSLRPL
jgi:hypothetical protein